MFFRHQFRTCRSEHRHHSAISLCALPLVQIFERTFTALRYITVFGSFCSIGITSSYAFSIRGNGFPIKEFYFLNLENLNILISHIMMYIFCVLYRTPYDFEDRPLCPHCLSPLIFLEMSGADFGDTFQQAVRTFGGHREKYRLILFCNTHTTFVLRCGKRYEIIPCRAGSRGLNPHIFNTENTDNRNSAFSRRIPAY